MPDYIMVGTVDKIVLGLDSTITIAGSIHNLKRVTNFEVKREEYHDSVKNGIVKHWGRANTSADVEIYLTHPEFITLGGNISTESNGQPVPIAIIITYIGVDGTTSTITGSAVLSNLKSAETDISEKSIATLHLDFVETPVFATAP